MFDQGEQIQLIDGGRRCVIKAAQVGVVIYYFSKQLRQRQRGKAVENSSPESAHAFYLLGQKPFQQAVVLSKLASDHRGAKSQTILAGDFAQQLCPAVQVFRIPHLHFAILSSAPRKNT